MVHRAATVLTTGRPICPQADHVGPARPDTLRRPDERAEVLVSGDVYIDAAVLSRVRRNLHDVREVMQRPARAMAEVTGSAMGAPDLARRMDEFGSEWSYGIGQLARFAGDAVEALDAIESAFEQADACLAGALRDAYRR
jgi:hypothetical protein